MKVILDTNVWVSGLLWGGIPGQVLQLAYSGLIRIATSEILLAELETTLGYAKLQTRLRSLELTAEELLLVVQRLAELCPTVPLNVNGLQDPDDAMVLATALAASAEVIVTGDQDLLTLIEFSEIPIMTPQAFLERYFPTPGES